jgi:hypothetical protein
MNDEALQTTRHSASHIMAEAVLKIFPGAKLGIGPAIDDGFYYDFALPRPLEPETDFPLVEQEMRRIIAGGAPFVRRELAPAEARALFADQPFKLDATADKTGSDGSRAVSVVGVFPWQVLDNATAASACSAAGKRLCTAEEWRSACQGPERTAYAYGDSYDPGVCNGIDAFRPAGLPPGPHRRLPGLHERLGHVRHQRQPVGARR